MPHNWSLEEEEEEEEEQSASCTAGSYRQSSFWSLEEEEERSAREVALPDPRDSPHSEAGAEPKGGCTAGSGGGVGGARGAALPDPRDCRHSGASRRRRRRSRTQVEAALPDPPDSLHSGAWSPYMQVCGEVSFLGVSKDIEGCWKATFLGMSKLIWEVEGSGGVLESDFSDDVQANFGGCGEWRKAGERLF